MSTLTQLTELTSLTDDDILYVVDNPLGTPASRYVKWSTIRQACATSFIAENLLGSDVASVSFTSIPSTFRHLRLIGYGRLTEAVTDDYIRVQFNGDTGTNYDSQQTYTFHTSTSFAAAYAQSNIRVADWTSVNATTATQASMFDITIAHYAGTTFDKTLTSVQSGKWGTSGATVASGTFSGFWRSTAAINRIDIIPTANNIKAGSIFSLYGMI